MQNGKLMDIGMIKSVKDLLAG